ncbi:MAG TPA: tetratricopeptide repeat-containing glycosyltransferase family protein [Burkholderiales bacterium]|nr:tetratricopeptide repeat-containing glycosyltransferase family protein [Burkholderiales bacterium]
MNRFTERLEAAAALGMQGRFEEALALARELAAANPSHAEGYLLCGNSLRGLGATLAAEACYRKALALQPGLAAAGYNLGMLLLEQDRPAEAEPLLADAWSRGIGFQALVGLAKCRLASGRGEDALRAVRQQLEAEPDDAQAHALHGFVLQTYRFEPEAALSAYAAALRLGLDSAELHANIGIAHQDLGALDEAIRQYDLALARDPGYPRARWQRALARLLQGEFAAAWPDYEVRLEHERRVRSPRFKAWQGESLSGRRIVVVAEQGVGDQIMFASCVPDLVAQGAKVTLECEPRLAALFRRSFEDVAVHGVRPGEIAVHAAGDYEIHAGSLPRYLRPDWASFPRRQAYLRADAAAVERWRLRLASAGPGPFIGFTWRGGTLQSRSPLRSLELVRLEPIFRARQATWVSLQHGVDAEEAPKLGQARGLRLLHFPEAIDELDELAALITALDLVVTACNSVVHLAGALGVRALVMAPFSPEWRYLAKGERLPWYPSVRVVRQARYGDWESVIAQVAQEVAAAPTRTGAPPRG